MSLSPGSTVIDQEKLRQLMAGGPNVPMIAPPLGGAPASPQLPALNFKQRQALPTVSEGTPAGSSDFYGNKIARIEDQQANPWGSADNHPGTLGKIGHVLSKIGNVAGDVADPAAMARIPGTDLNRQTQEKQLGAQQELAAQRETQGKQQAATEAYQTGELADRSKGRQLESDRIDMEREKQTPEQESLRDLTNHINPKTGVNYTPVEAEVERAQRLQDTKPDKTPKVDAAQEDQRYENIVANEKQGKPIAPEDKAWSQAYEKRKTLAPYASVAAAGQGTPGNSSDALVQAVANGSMKIGDVLTARVPIGARKAFLGAVMQANPDFHSADYDIEKGVARDFTSGKSAQNLTAFNTAIDHAKIADTAVDALRNGDIHSLNRMGNALGVELGQDPVTNFNVVKNALAGEISKVFKGGQATDAEIKHVMGPFDTANSPEQLKGAIHMAISLMNSKREALKEQYGAGRKAQPNFGDGEGGGEKKGNDPLGLGL